MNLTEFLLARYAEDEAVARDAAGGPWTWHEYVRKGDDPVPYLTGRGGDPETYAYDVEVIEPDHSGECGCRSACRLELRVRREDQEHIARHDPSRVQADIAAKRRIVEWCGEREQIHVGRIGSNPEAARPEDFVQGRVVRPADSVVLRYLAEAYADHPDYRPEWAPGSVSQP